MHKRVSFLLLTGCLLLAIACMRPCVAYAS